MSGRHGVQYLAQCVACAALTLVARHEIANLSVKKPVCARVARESSVLMRKSTEAAKANLRGARVMFGVARDLVCPGVPRS